MFIDETLIEVVAGNGGNGAVGFRREKYVPMGGPDGGNGGRGGHIILVASKDLHTLYDIGNRRTFKAKPGNDGSGSRSTGREGDDILVKVPLGTLVRHAETGELIKDMKAEGEQFIAARGGNGGKGNAVFKSATQQAPRKATPGEPGERTKLQLTLKLLADCGLVGFPNVGKSSLIRRISAATPKVADYPFTTVQPVLGMVVVDEGRSFVMVDIPGLIEGAAEGKGLGHQFLRHVERTLCLAFVIDASSDGAWDQFQTLRNELERFHPLLLEKPYFVVLNKMDLGVEQIDSRFETLKVPLIKTSAVTGEGLEDLKKEAFRLVLAKGPKRSEW